METCGDIKHDRPRWGVWFAENGPFHINQDLTLSENKYGWDKSHNMIFVDQPIGTGFSYTDDDADTVYTEQGASPFTTLLCLVHRHSVQLGHASAPSMKESNATREQASAAVADDMIDFLVDFFAAHPELASNPFYVTGESYAGHYVPAVSHRIWQWNKAGDGPKINFKGFAIGVLPAWGKRCAATARHSHDQRHPGHSSTDD